MPQGHEEQSVIWPQEIQDDPMDGGISGEDDFSKFLDLDSEFQFAGLDHGQSAIDMPMGRLAFGQPSGPQPGAQAAGYTGAHPMNLDMSVGRGPTGFENHMHNGQQFEAFQQQYHHPMQMHHPYQVPPTPVSTEMHAAKYGAHVDATGQLMFERQQVSFTPLVSPAQTPLTHAYTMPQYGLADEFFSPLTSPAIEPQNPYSSARTTASPIDLNVDSGSKTTSAPRTRKRRGSVSTRTGGRSVKQSPVVKPKGGRRKQSLTNMSIDKVTELLNQATNARGKAAQVRQTPSIPAHVLASAARSSDDSVSPEPLSESLMGPPPVPSVDKSPRVFGLARQNSGNGVTPMALMSLPGKTPGSGSGIEEATAALPEDGLEEMMLPDAAAPVPARISEPGSARSRGNDQSPPRLSTGPVAKGSGNAGPRTMLPKTPVDEGLSRTPKVDGRPGTARGKKRATTTSATISPAIRPKISPNISPLVPAAGGTPRTVGMSHLSAETSALYLASKSNYQNIIDGTHLPGVSYPEALAENLSSKRTSHKIAEQGRRNRINLALKEIETLLPPALASPITKKEGNIEPETPGKATSSAQGASKASTVEMAIVYIKSLQAELADTKDKLSAAEKKLAADTNSSAGSQTSE